MNTFPQSFRVAFSLILLLLMSVSAFSQIRKLGLQMDDAAYDRLPRKSKNLVFKGVNPPAFDLKSYLPEVGDQGDFGTCIGWSTAYYLRTVMEARKAGYKNNPGQIVRVRFSPSWLYSAVKESSDYDCQKGAMFPDALEVLKNRGAALLSCAPYQCGNAFANCNTDAANFKIEDYATLFNAKDESTSSAEKILSIKTALVETSNPVLIGMQVPRSFMLQAASAWRAAPGESIEKTLGGHAMAVVGYDEGINGGSFLIVNSWGKEWGDKGFTWANSEDMIRFTKYAFQIYSAPAPQPQPTTVTLKGTMEFTLTSGTMPVFSAVSKGIDVTPDQPNSNAEMITYTMSNSYTSGTRFKLNVNNNKQSYVYILGSDQKNRVSKLFPFDRSATISPVVPANNAVLLPTINDSFTLDNVTGEDYFLVLISEKELNLDEIASKIKNASGTIVQKAYAALGTQFIAPRDMSYEPSKIAYEVKGNPQGNIVPLLVKIKHI